MQNNRFTYAFSICAFVLISGLVSANVEAESDISISMGLRPTYEKCGDSSGGVTVAMLNCDGPEYKYQKRRLNEVYKTLMKKLDPIGQAELRDEEGKWIAYRDYFCAPDPDGGTAADVGSSSCFVYETAKQATALEARPGQPVVLTQYESRLYGVRPPYINCMQPKIISAKETSACVAVEYKFQDRRLNTVYKALLAKLGEAEKKDFV